MATLLEVKKRIKSVKNISQVTKAMELVAASKMKKAQQIAQMSRPFSEKLMEISGNLSARIDPTLHPLLRKSEGEEDILIVLLSPEKGLCGPLVSTLFRNTLKFMDLKRAEAPLNIKFLTIGRKGRDYILHSKFDLVADFENLGDKPQIADLRPILKIITDGYLSGEFGRVYLSFTAFINTLRQEPRVLKILPIERLVESEEESREDNLVYNYLYEPDADTILKSLLPLYLEMQLYQSYLEAIASEHSARMVSMRSATENAKEIQYDLTLEYNKARQASITKEILEISVGAGEGR